LDKGSCNQGSDETQLHSKLHAFDCKAMHGSYTGITLHASKTVQIHGMHTDAMATSPYNIPQLFALLEHAGALH
jgi:hypothetical protein